MSSKSSTDPSDPGTVAVGRVLRPHGLRGEVVVEVASDNPERFAVGAELLLMAPGEAGEAAPGAARRRLTVASVREHRGVLLVGFGGVEDRDAADALRGELAVPAGDVPEPPAGSWYHYQLFGCRVTDRANGPLGEVVDLIEDGGGLLLVVEGRGRRVPVPFVERFLVRVDVEAREIEVALPEGLVETCASTS
ncbi:MAG TPA: ribosome maturation factor RimM [Thermoanaerobaculia bacterium]|nr:ribosome maturation factor RimM [Thermoanaerobaculia bacterium]